MVSKKSSAPRWPKGHPKAGKFAPRDLYAEYTAELKARERAQRRREALDRKNKTARENRAVKRSTAKQVLADRNKPGLKGELFGSTSASRLRANTVYGWYGVFTVQGGAEALGVILNQANSAGKVLLKRSDEDEEEAAWEEAEEEEEELLDPHYVVTITPFFGNYTPAEALVKNPEHAQQEMEKYQRSGAKVEYHGAQYVKLPEKGTAPTKRRGRA